jgi:hypothetical protein
MPEPVVVQPVRNGRALRRFISLPFRLFGDDPAWVPPLRMSVRDRLSPKHPANGHQETALWLAYRGGTPVGRIGACVDRMFNEYQDEAWAWVGFFEATDDAEVAGALFEEARAWSKARGMSTMVGPGSFTTNDEPLGLQVEGFEHPPVVMTAQNPPYYEALWTGGGWRPAMDLWAWRLDRERADPAPSERQRAVIERMMTRSRLRVREGNLSDFDAEVGRIFRVYEAAWARNWGFSPMTEAEVRHMAKDLKQVVNPHWVLFVEREGADEPLAFALALPDINRALVKLRQGRLVPFGWWRLLRVAKARRSARVLLLGARPEVQGLALGAILYHELIQRSFVVDPSFETAELSWILATNDRMNSAAELLGAKRYKTWRLYEQAV